MTEADKEILRKQQEEERKKILDLSIKFSQENGRNINDNWYSLKDTPNGPVLGVVGDIDPKTMKMPDGWRYEPHWLLNSDYPQEGLVREVNGKREFIPIKHIEDKTKVMEYRDINDVRAAILSANYPAISTENCQIDPQTGGLKLIAVRPGLITMPQGLKMDNGSLVDNLGRRFEVSEENAHASYGNIKAGGEASRTTNIEQAPQQEDVKSEYEEKHVILNSSHIKLMVDLDELIAVYQMYSKNKKEQVFESTKDGSYKNFQGDKVTDPNKLAQYEIAEAWVEAYGRATGAKGDQAVEGSISNMDVEYRACMSVVGSLRGMSLRVITTALFDLYDFENSNMVEVILYFISDPRIANMFDIQLDISPKEAIALRETLKNKSLSSGLQGISQEIRGYKGRFQELMGKNIESNKELDDEDVMVKTMNPNNGSNGGGSYN